MLEIILKIYFKNIHEDIELIFKLTVLVYDLSLLLSIFFSFPTLPPEFGASVENIFVAMLAMTNDIKDVGPNKLLEILTNEIEPLEKNGIVIGNKTIYIVPVQLGGDNLGLNFNLGYTAPTSTYFCRICFMDISRARVCCSEDENILRTEEHYLQCISNLSNLKSGKTNYGIVGKCDLNRLKCFKVSRNYVYDIMHDLLVGLFGYDVMGILKKGVENNLFTLSQFNNAKNDFDYGSKEVHYILEDVNPNHLKNETIKGHAREIMTLIRFLPFILKKLLPEDHKLFLFGLTVTDLLDFVLKTSFTNQDLIRMKELVTSHNQQFLQLFDRTLPPKGHYILHYARIIEHIGPLKYIWSMRFEAKHQQMKAYAKVCFSRRNLCFSLGKKICYYNANDAMKNKNIFTRLGDYTSIYVQFQNEFNNQLSEYQNCNKVEYNGRMYTIGDFIVSSCQQFASKIIEIAVTSQSDSVLLIIEKYDIIFEAKFRCYEISEKISSALHCYNIDSFVFPATKTHFYNAKYYIKCENF